MKESKWKRESGELSWVLFGCFVHYRDLSSSFSCSSCVCTCKFKCVSIREKVSESWREM